MNPIQAAYIYLCLVIGSIINDVKKFFGGKNDRKKK